MPSKWRTTGIPVYLFRQMDGDWKLTLGGVLAYDMREHNASLKIKFLTTAIEHNADRRAWRLAGSENLENSRSPRQAGKSADGLRVLPTASGR